MPPLFWCYNFYMKIRKMGFLVLFFILSAASAFSDAAEKRERFINAAKSYLGTPYRYGGISKAGIDCSGLVYKAALDSGTAQLPRTAATIYRKAEQISDSQRERGDLVFFSANGRISHVGIYLGENQFIHSASDGPKTGVIISRLSENYWKNHYYSAGRFLESTGKTESSGSYSQKSSSQKSKSASSNRTGTKIAGTDRTSGSPQIKRRNFTADFSGFFSWNFLNQEEIKFYAKGGSLQAEIRTDIWNSNPGIFLRMNYLYNPEKNFFQSFEFPAGFLLNLNSYMQVYGGVVFSFNKYPEYKVNKSGDFSFEMIPVFFGARFQTPEIKINSFSSLVLSQDISYTGYTGSNLETGLSFNTGISFRLKF